MNVNACTDSDYHYSYIANFDLKITLPGGPKKRGYRCKSTLYAVYALNCLVLDATRRSVREVWFTDE